MKAYAPHINIQSTEFIGNGDAIFLEATGHNLEETNYDQKTDEPFRGDINIGNADGGIVTFYKNTRGLTFKSAYPAATFVVQNVDFINNKNHGAKFALPYGTEAQFIGVNIDGPVPGKTRAASDAALRSANGAIPGQVMEFDHRKGSGVVLSSGRGKFTATINKTRTSKGPPSIEIGAGWRGIYDIALPLRVSPTVIGLPTNHSICRADLTNRKQRKTYEGKLNRLKLSIDQNKTIAALFEKNKPPLSKQEMQEAQYYLCRYPS